MKIINLWNEIIYFLSIHIYYTTIKESKEINNTLFRAMVTAERQELLELERTHTKERLWDNTVFYFLSRKVGLWSFILYFSRMVYVYFPTFFKKSPYGMCLDFCRNIMSGLLFIFHGWSNTEIVLVLLISFTLCVQRISGNKTRIF